MGVLRVDHLTKDYGNHKGVFDVSFEIEQGEVFGFLGPNGAGKTTTIRHILGFSRPQGGQTWVDGMDSWRQASLIQKELGYLPGEIAFPNDMTGTQFIRFMAKLRGMKDMGRSKELTELFELDASGGLKRMSKGMKQKVGIVCAFMHDPKILVLDEPTSGLDPLMQSRFVSLIAREKQAGKTILMSSHLFEEVEKTCDRVAIIKQGKILSTIGTEEFKHARQKIYKLEFLSAEEYARFVKEPLEFVETSEEKLQAEISVNDEEINGLIRTLGGYRLKFLSEQKHTLERYFMRFYGGNDDVE